MNTTELRARFLPRFTQTARERLARGRSSTDPRRLSAELHALAGEAAALGFSSIAALARSIIDALQGGEALEHQEGRLRALETVIRAL